MADKEDYALVLDYLPYGYPMEKRRMPVAQAIGVKGLALLELIPRKGISLQSKEKVYIGPEKRDKIYYIAGRLPREKMTENAKQNLHEFIEITVAEREQEYISFFNKAGAINTRLHQLELLPGFGKKHTQELIQARDEKTFDSFEEIKQ